MIDIEELKNSHSVESVLSSRGISVKGGKFCCPFHDDKNPSANAYSDGGWHCHRCGFGGDVIDLLARFEDKTAAQYLRDIGQSKRLRLPVRASGMSARPELPPEPKTSPEAKSGPKPRIVATYAYHDANGKKVYEALRYEPKDFRQRRDENTWSMDGVERVLFRLPAVIKSKEVWIVEGEKDANNLARLGFAATCNVGGACKWLESYSAYLKDKDLILCGDNDAKGREHVEMVRSMTVKLARSIRIVWVPTGKDISDYLQDMPEGEKKTAVTALRNSVEPLYQGEPLPLKSMAELEHAYVESFHRDTTHCLDMGRWLPKLNDAKVFPGEMVVIIAETGVGKSSILTNIAITHPHLSTVYFHLELSDKKVFERSIQTAMGMNRGQIRERYAGGGRVAWEQGGALDHMLTCTESRLSLQKIESIVKRSELRFGSKPRMVMIDYIQLMRSQSKQSRYEMFTDFAEGLKQMSKELGVVTVVASQVNRDKDRSYAGLSINDAKDSGAIENSCSLMLGASRNPEKKTEMCIQVLKGTEIGAGRKIYCTYDFDSLSILENAKPKPDPRDPA